MQYLITMYVHNMVLSAQEEYRTEILENLVPCTYYKTVKSVKCISCYKT